MSKILIWILGGITVVAGVAVAIFVASGLQTDVAVVPVPQSGDPARIEQVPQPDAPQVAASGVDQTPTVSPAADPATETVAGPLPPVFDVVRVARDGGALVAGEAAPDSAVTLRVDGVAVAQTSADGTGQFVAMFSLGTSDAPQMMTLEMADADGTVILSDDTVILTPRPAEEVIAAAPPVETPPPAEVVQLAEALPTLPTAPVSVSEVTLNESEETELSAAPVSDLPLVQSETASEPSVEMAELQPELPPQSVVTATPAPLPEAAPVLHDAGSSPVTPDQVTPRTEAFAEASPIVSTEIAADEQDGRVAVAPQSDITPSAPTGTPTLEPTPNPDAIVVADAAAPAETPGEGALISEAASPSTMALTTRELASQSPVAETLAQSPQLATSQPDSAQTAEAQPVSEETVRDGTVQSQSASVAAETQPVNGASDAPTVLQASDGQVALDEAAPTEVASVPAPHAPQTPALETPAEQLATQPTPEDATESAADMTADAEASMPTAFMVRSSGAVEVLDRAPQVMDNVVIDSISYSSVGDVQIAGRAGQNESGANLRIYLNNMPIALARSEHGDWTSDLPHIDPGVYTLRVDQLSDAGQVVSRFETPFQREDPELVIAAQARTQPRVPTELEAHPTADANVQPQPRLVRNGAQGPASGDQLAVDQAPSAHTMSAQTTGQPDIPAPTPPVSLITVQPGHTLWAISRQRYGAGELYVVIYRANRSQIRDPDLIYPGQIFTLPDN